MSTARANLKTEVSADTTSFSAAMRRTSSMAQATGAKVAKSFAGAAGGLGRMAASATRAAANITAIGVALGAGAFVAGIKSAADMGGALSDLSARTGISAGQLAVLQRAMEDNGVAGDKVGGIINKLQKQIGDFGYGMASASRPFEALGISFAQISKLSPDRQFALIQQKISAIEDPTQRAAIAMQIFGRSGGELLTLFADKGAFANAGAFLGSQAGILDRSAAVFDGISDKLARIPDKLGGFFVGFLEPFAVRIDELLTDFDSFDFAALGQQFAAAADAIDMKAAVEMAKSFGDGMLTAADFLFQAYQYAQKFGALLGAVFGTLFSSQYWAAIGIMIQETFLSGVNIFYKGLTATIAAGKQAFVSLGELALTVFGELMKPELWSGLASTLQGIALSFGAVFLETIGTVIKQLEKIPGVKKLLGDSSGIVSDQAAKLREQSEIAAAAGKSGIDPSINAIKAAAENGAVAVKDAFSDAFGATDDLFDTSGMGQKAEDLIAPFADQLADILNIPIESIRDKLKPVIDAFAKGAAAGAGGANGKAGALSKGDEARAAGFKGLGELYDMNAGGPRGFGSKGATLGGGVFGKDRARLGLASGLTTGGLGSVRKVGSLRDAQEARKKEFAAKTIQQDVSDIATNLKQALSVA